MQSIASQFSAVFLVEHDRHGGVMCTWNYPSMETAAEQRCVRRITSMGADLPELVHFRVKSDWCYVLTTLADKSVTPALDLVSVGLLVKNFNPEKYQALLRLFAEQYRLTADPTKVLEAYLSVFTTGQYALRGSSWRASDWKDERAYVSTGIISLKDLVTMLGVEAAVLWNAIVLKKRVCVLCDNVQRLLAVTRVLPQLAWHRQDWNIVRPYLAFDDAELADLMTSGVYVAGFTDARITTREDVFDVLLNISERSVTVADHAAEEMKMGQLHREVVAALVQASESGNEQDVLKAVARKTKDVSDELHRLAESNSGKVTEQLLASKNMNATMLRFYMRFALAEGLA